MIWKWLESCYTTWSLSKSLPPLSTNMQPPGVTTPPQFLGHADYLQANLLWASALFGLYPFAMLSPRVPLLHRGPLQEPTTIWLTLPAGLLVIRVAKATLNFLHLNFSPNLTLLSPLTRMPPGICTPSTPSSAHLSLPSCVASNNPWGRGSD